jgi:hypothetical protein
MKDIGVRMRSIMTVLGVLCVVALLAAPPAHAQNQCAAAKLGATGEAIDALLECHAQAVVQGAPLDVDCVARANAHLVKAFAKAERADTCRAPGDAPTLQGQIAGVVTAIATDLGGPGPSHCTRDKLRAAGRKAERLHDCFATAAAMGPGQGGDHRCLERAEAAFLKAFAKAETPGDCLAPTGDAGAIEERIEAGLVQSRAALAPPLLTCEPVAVTAIHGQSPFFGNDSLARIEDGKVPCAHTETAEVALCIFSTTPGSESGEWVESPQGNYARSGQAISLQGVPGGDYVIGAQVVSSAGTFPCIEPAGGDTTGLASSIPLSGGCTPETPLSPRNATGHKLENYATREVCSSSHPHPDQHGDDGETKPLLTFRDVDRDPALACWTGEGAALNDRGGRERDIHGVYLPETFHCHMVQLTPGYGFLAAKRPGMKSENGALVVDDTTPIVWRPVSPVPNIANGAEAPGTIIGDVNLACAAAGGTPVFILEGSFSAITDSDGQFALSPVPIGAYTIRIDPSGPAHHDIPGVVVRPNRTTDLGTILIGSTDTDVNNCGACGNACSVANGTPTCTAGSCQIAFCNAGFHNCDGLAANGCEKNLLTDPSNCGFCGTACAAGQACISGTCQ